MPIAVAAALLGAGLYAGYRLYSSLQERMADELARAEADHRRQRGEKDLGRLEFDPASGVYKPSRRG
ncbi:MAG TPA: hypothetical protein PK264_02615 [Hyphomicrobiaceae bacterium]|nr:hypothetical protein [Hyphomicrobiaceae bacterium]